MKARTILIWLLFVAACTVLVFLNRPVSEATHVNSTETVEVPIPPEHQAGLAQYERLYAAVGNDDARELQSLIDSGDGYVRYEAALALANIGSVPAEERLAAIELALELRINDTLKRLELRALHVLHGAIAEEAEEFDTALAAYIRALPDAAAVRAVTRLQPDALERARIFAQAGLHTETLDALDGLVVPSLEAPALRALGRHEEALASYRAWLADSPENEAALLGEAWSLFSLDRIAAAGEKFIALGPAGFYGMGLVENRIGNIDAAGEYLIRSNTAANKWLATTLYERAGMLDEAIETYLDLARGESNYADDAAFRAYVLADRANNAFLAAEALALLPEDNFFRERLDLAHYPVEDAELGEYEPVELPVFSFADTLTAHGLPHAAQGELLFALRDAEETGDAALIGAVAEQLQKQGEFRMSAQAAQRLVRQDSRELRWWLLAYPAAWQETVESTAEEFGVEPALMWAVMRQESAYSPVAVSVSNARGLMQFVPSTWDWIGELLGEEPGEPFHPETNIRYGAKYLGWLLDYFAGDDELAIASYNGGQGYVGRLLESDLVGNDKVELFRHFDRIETREYLARVTEHRTVYRVLYGD